MRSVVATCRAGAKYTVAVLEVHCQSFMPTLISLPEPGEQPRQFEGPPAAEEAA
jgi:hypothetical protein